MSTISFDTLKFANRLKAAGVPPQQAEAEAEALAEALADAVKTSDLTTKADLSEAEMRIIKWVVGMALAQFALLAGVLMKIPA